jgi:GGDEF domain-containing protein
LVAAISVPHDELRVLELDETDRVAVQALHLAEMLARFLTSEQTPVLDELLATGRLYCELTMSQLEALIHSMEPQVIQLADILALNLPGQSTYSSILAAAYKQLSAAAEEATTGLIGQAPAPNEDLAKCVEQFAGDPLYPQQPSYTDVIRPSEGAVADVTPDPGLAAHVAAAVAHCRQARKSLSLLLVEFDDFSTHLLTRGPQGAERAVRRLCDVIARTHRGAGEVVILTDVRFALILPKYERQPAVQLARQLIDNVRDWSSEESRRGQSAVSVSAGIATLAMPPKNFPAAELIDAAERCLSGSQLSGGDSVKSIDI